MKTLIFLLLIISFNVKAQTCDCSDWDKVEWHIKNNANTIPWKNHIYYREDALPTQPPQVITQLIHDTIKINVVKVVKKTIHDTITIVKLVEKEHPIDSTTSAYIKPTFTTIDMNTKFYRFGNKLIPYVEQVYYNKLNKPYLTVKLEPINLTPIIWTKQ
jgi:hypothetical protein